ncbi:MAG: murein hydrolase activator EnvC family protein, partial [Pseudohongiellaceae bacterium]
MIERAGTRARVLLLGLLLALPVVAQDRAQDSARDDARARQQLEAVSTAIAEVESWLDRADSELDASQEALRQAELEVSNLRQEISALESEIASTRADLTALRQRQQSLEQDKDNQATLLGDVLRAAYMAGDHNRLRLLLDGDDPSKAARLLHYAGEFSRHQLQLIEQFQTILAELDSVQEQLDRQLADLGSQQQQLEQRSNRLAAARDERATALAALRGDIQSRNQELEQLQF